MQETTGQDGPVWAVAAAVVAAADLQPSSFGSETVRAVGFEGDARARRRREAQSRQLVAGHSPVGATGIEPVTSAV